MWQQSGLATQETQAWIYPISEIAKATVKVCIWHPEDNKYMDDIFCWYTDLVLHIHRYLICGFHQRVIENIE